MLSRTPLRGAIAVLAGVVSLAISACPSAAFTLHAPSPAQSVEASGVEPVWWDAWGGWHPNWWGPYHHHHHHHYYYYHPYYHHHHHYHYYYPYHHHHHYYYYYYHHPHRHCWIGYWGYLQCGWW